VILSLPRDDSQSSLVKHLLPMLMQVTQGEVPQSGVDDDDDYFKIFAMLEVFQMLTSIIINPLIEQWSRWLVMNNLFDFLAGETVFLSHL